MARILFVVNHAGFFLSHRLPLATAARAAGYDVHIATPPSKHVEAIGNQGLPWHPILMTRSGRGVIDECRSVRDIARLYSRLKPTLVHHVTTKPVIYGTIAARLTKVPAVVNAIAGLGHVFSSSATADRLFAACLRLAYCVAVRHPNVRCIFQNSRDRAIFLETGCLREAQTVLIPGSGVDLDKYRPARGVSAVVPRVVLISRMIAPKGVREFVEAARVLKSRGAQARFILIGEPDPDNPASIGGAELRQWESEGTIEWWGRREDIADILRASEIACLPSYYGEGMPKSLIEAAACGLPIVTTDQPGCRDVVVNGLNGFTVPIRDVGALVEALALLIRDSDLRRRMGAAGRLRATQLFGLDSVVDATLRVYEDLLR